jgi:RNA polymerase sigma-70 factor (ECF subfamily)
METYRRYAPALIRKAERMLQSHDDALDVVHGVFVEILQRDTSDIDLPYLYRAVTNRCLNLIRDQSARRRLLERQDVVLRGPIRSTCEDRAIDLDLLTKLSARLDRQNVEILVYRYVDDMTQDEIASLLGLSRKTVGHRLDRIHDTVRQLVADGGGAA